MWALQLPALQEVSQVWALDLPGFGAEPPLREAARRAEAYADWVAARLREPGAGPRAVAGYSFGGTVALLLAARHPELVSRLALCCTSPRWGRGLGSLASAALAGPAGLAFAALLQATVRLAFRRARGLGGEGAAEVRDMLARAHRPTMASLCRSLARADHRGALAAVRCPTLVVGGTREFLVSAGQHRRTAAGIAGAALRLLPGAGHMLCLTRAEEFSSVLVDFLSGRAARRGGARGGCGGTAR